MKKDTTKNAMRLVTVVVRELPTSLQKSCLFGRLFQTPSRLSSTQNLEQQKNPQKCLLTSPGKCTEKYKSVNPSTPPSHGKDVSMGYSLLEPHGTEAHKGPCADQRSSDKP